MPSFDVVSKVDSQEVRNAVDQANRELETRFDFKGANARFQLESDQVTLRGPNEFQLKQMYDILVSRLVKRKIDVRCLKVDPAQVNVSEASQAVHVRSGIDTDLARELVKMVKTRKLKVQAAIQGDSIRISGKKRDDLQTVMGMLKEAEIDMPLQFDNYRD